MNSEQEAKIESGVATCLDACRSTDRPYSRVVEYIAGLKDDPEWTADEIIELQTRVIRVLLYRGGRPPASSL